ncbi:transposase [Nonomuraea sp. NBC_00507]|uniref:transposase n=1 Tax=Nonomuraea sp. NBC_00507 TaxID=2976002 RepID=UPI003FA5A49D
MSDAEWQVIKPLMPWPAWLYGNGGRPEKYCRRRIMDAIRYVVDFSELPRISGSVRTCVV